MPETPGGSTESLRRGPSGATRIQILAVAGLLALLAGHKVQEWNREAWLQNSLDAVASVRHRAAQAVGEEEIDYNIPPIWWLDPWRYIKGKGAKLVMENPVTDYVQEQVGEFELTKKARTGLENTEKALRGVDKASFWGPFAAVFLAVRAGLRRAFRNKGEEAEAEAGASEEAES